MNDRARHLLTGLDKTAKLIEIGPSLNPLAPKRDGWNVTVVDHETREGLIHKYRSDPAVDPDVIEEVDLVWHGGSLEDLAGEASWGDIRRLHRQPRHRAHHGCRGLPEVRADAAEG